MEIGILKTQKEMIQETLQTVIQLSTVLLGVPDTEDTGLVGEIKDLKINHISLNKKHNKLSRNFWILISALVGSGGLGSSIYGLLSG